MMKKTALLFSALVACGMGMSVANAAQTVSLGYAQAKVDDFKDLKGITAKYHYQGDSALGIIGSFTYVSAKETEYYQNSLNDHYKFKYYSLMAGPSYRFNDIVSIYGLSGIGYGKSSWEEGDIVSRRSGSENKSSFAYGFGVQIAPTDNWVIDAGYEGTKIYDTRADGFNIGVGYRF
ncbi:MULTISPECIES: Ail/Lom family outer membrane beta-barrel protein [unclassified Brenneria]|uniref:Ail/Lom family outer membrane beta-barrel protein n=1 Tax=unclassified Brenneria TaxID=2634434 RepID=UPI0029C34355|nr:MULTISPECIES: Ail/Lom family outer membrane beta-barrel protein [unclassified Brenneria]MDX5629928.1 Ail/Lom family outer membrane beta-barrel protein [Brenneria sp. L3-3Z]MDX5697074.1 Ail/Lom family outer membrane beta-barrel protein [Brenneria sp. L4-2C]